MGDTTLMSITSIGSNVEIIRGYEGADRASHEKCQRKTPDSMIG
jgi:hypothetical protein